jgi:hypothetical protein
MNVPKEPEILIQTDPLPGQPFGSEAQDSDGKEAGSEYQETESSREKKPQTY